MTEPFAKIISNVNLKPLTVLAKSSILDIWIGPECAFPSECNTVPKIQTEITPWQEVKMASFWSNLYIWNLVQWGLSINRPIKQLPKVFSR